MGFSRAVTPQANQRPHTDFCIRASDCPEILDLQIADEEMI